ncbi:MAG: hypothetical protein ABSD13_11310 [Candidatus Korobacteraceae bacterium]
MSEQELNLQSALEWLDEEIPKELRSALKRQLFLFATMGLHSEGFEIESLIVGFDIDGLVVAPMSRLIRHGTLDAFAPHRGSPDGGRPFADFLSCSICRCAKSVGINSSKDLVETGVTANQLLLRVLKELGDVFESFVSKAIFVKICEKLPAPEIATSNCFRRRFALSRRGRLYCYPGT